MLCLDSGGNLIEINKKRKAKPVFIRKSDCIHYSRCLNSHASDNTEFSCEGCDKYRSESLSSIDAGNDYSGCLLLLRAVFFPKADDRRV